MSRTPKTALTAEAVISAIEAHKPDNIAKLAHALGYKGSVSSWLKTKLTTLVPGLAARLAANKTAAVGDATHETTGGSPATPTAKSKATKRSGAGKYPRCESNPFREGSAYGVTFDILSANPEGIERSKLVAEVARITGKSQKKCYFDVTVVASSRKEGGSHKCISRAADRYYVDRTEGGWLKLVLR